MVSTLEVKWIQRGEGVMEQQTDRRVQITLFIIQLSTHGTNMRRREVY